MHIGFDSAPSTISLYLCRYGGSSTLVVEVRGVVKANAASFEAVLRAAMVLVGHPRSFETVRKRVTNRKNDG